MQRFRHLMTIAAHVVPSPTPVPSSDPPVGPTFMESASMFAHFVGRLDPRALPPLGPDATRAAVLITPWCSCPVAWFSLTVAWLLRREGIRVSLLWNDICDNPEAATFQFETQIIGALMPAFRGFEIIRLSEQHPTQPAPVDRRRLAAAAEANAIWQNRGSLPRERVAALAQQMETILASSLPAVEELFARHRFDFAFVPGGMYGNSGLFVDAGRARGVRMSTYDANPGNILIGLRGAASCCPDAPRCLRDADQLLGDRQPAARQIARQRLRERMSATEKFFTERGFAGQPVQMLSVDQDRNRYDDEVIIPLNVEWDAAALGLHRFFRDDCEWLVQTVGFILTETNARVCVRQHPGNRVVVDGAANLEQELAQRYGQHPRFRFVRAQDAVSTYKLLENARLVLPFTTTLGIEAAMLGKPLVLESRAYYAEMPFAEAFSDQRAYFARIAEQIRQPSPPDPGKIAAAELAYFFTAVCNFVPTRLTPHPEDFAVWSQLSLDALMAEPGVQTVVRALVDDIPTAALQSAAHLDRQTPPPPPAEARPRSVTGIEPARPAVPNTISAPYGVARVNATTLARIASAPETWAQILDFHGALASDDYVRAVDAFYRDNLKRFGQHWHYLDIVNVLFAASRALQPRSYLEIGVRRGRSACTVARGCPTVNIVACDMWQPNYAGMDNPGPELVRSELAQHGHRGSLSFVSGDSHVILPRLFTENPLLRFDLITVDGDHSVDGAYRDLCDVAPHLQPGGVLVFDDISHPAHPYLLDVWRRFVSEHPFLSSFTFVEQGYGVAFAIRTG